MTPKQEKYAKVLRSSIMAIAIKQYGWDYDQFHNIMKEWGYGDSLRKLNVFQLKELKAHLTGKTPLKDGNKHPVCSASTPIGEGNKHPVCSASTPLREGNYSGNWKLDKQGKFMWGLMKQAGWDKNRLVKLMVKKYQKTHWNLLIEPEKRQVISILRSYIKK